MGRMDVIFLDCTHPSVNVFRFARTAARRSRIVFVADVPAMGWVRRALQVGASGFVLTSEGADEWSRCLGPVRAGLHYYSPGAARVVAELATRESGSALTDREIQVLQFICDGRTSKEIGRYLELSPKSVDAHRARIMEKTGVGSATGLVRYACQHRFVELHGAQR